MRSIAVVVLLWLSAIQVAAAQSPPASAPPDIVDMDTLVVSGAQPGPGMWKVSKGENVLYILGTLSPLPKRMDWIPDEAEKIIAQSQAVIDPPYFMASGVGYFRGMLLLPSLLKARRDPDGRTLQQSVPPDLYARWVVLKRRYIGRDAGIEKWRPFFAAQELYEEAMKDSGLSRDNVVLPVVAAAAKKHRVPRVSTKVEYKIENPKALLREFRATTLADTDCFAKTMDRIETDLDAMRARANAWAVGDVAALRDMPLEDQYVACIRAVTETELARKLGVDDVRMKMSGIWMSAAENALARNRVTFATLPMPFLLRPDGFIERLRAKGYVIEEP